MLRLMFMADTDQSDSDTYSEAETVERREAALKQAFATPHKPHKPGKEKAAESNRKTGKL